MQAGVDLASGGAGDHRLHEGGQHRAADLHREGEVGARHRPLGEVELRERLDAGHLGCDREAPRRVVLGDRAEAPRLVAHQLPRDPRGRSDADVAVIRALGADDAGLPLGQVLEVGEVGEDLLRCGADDGAALDPFHRPR